LLSRQYLHDRTVGIVMFESPYEVSFVATTVILGWVAWGVFVLIVNKMLRRADIRHTEAKLIQKIHDTQPEILTFNEYRDIRGAQPFDEGHKHNYRLKRVTATHYGFMCEGHMWNWGRKVACEHWRDISKTDFWGDPMSTKRLFAKAVREMKR